MDFQYIMNSTSIKLTAILILAIALVFGGTITNNFGKISSASAQIYNKTTAGTTGGPITNISNITGTIHLKSVVINAITSKIKVSLGQAVSAAEKLVGNNSHVVAAHLGHNVGYLVYTIYASDQDANLEKIIVDPANGKVLAKQQVPFSSITSLEKEIWPGG